MRERLLIAGSGGQGVILIGKLLATAAMEEIPHVTFFPAYTIEVRGGTANCQVVLSSEEIASPVSDCFDSVVLMNQAGADRFARLCNGENLVVVNRSLCRFQGNGRALMIGANEEAERLGDARSVNLVMLGAYLAGKPLVKTETVEREIRKAFAGKSQDLAGINVAAFRAGLKLGRRECGRRGFPSRARGVP